MGVKRIAALALSLLVAAAFAHGSAADEPAECKAASLSSAGEPKAMGEVDFELEASAMALIEADTGTLLAQSGCDIGLPMASTTKIMTAMLVIKHCGLDETVEIPEEAVGVEGSSMYLCRGESLTVRDLLYGLMLASGNDAAVALACHAGGTVKGFVDMMNEEARAMGLGATHFVTPNGLHAEGHKTTAYELCLIARAALVMPEFKQIVSTRYYTTESGDHPRTFKNKNALLWDFEGAVGVKTGYTSAAGRCLVFAAERDGMTVIGALLNCRPMFEKASMLLDYAFDNFTVCTVIPKGAPAGRTKVENGIESILAAVTKDSIITVMQKGERASFTAEAEFYRLDAPVFAGQQVGVLSIYRSGTLIGSTPLTAACDVDARDMRFWFDILSAAFAS